MRVRFLVDVTLGNDEIVRIQQIIDQEPKVRIFIDGYPVPLPGRLEGAREVPSEV